VPKPTSTATLRTEGFLVIISSMAISTRIAASPYGARIGRGTGIVEVRPGPVYIGRT